MDGCPDCAGLAAAAAANPPCGGPVGVLATAAAALV